MKILILQLARLGDIYQTWPAVRAFKRTHPDATIDLMVRKRFLEATRGIDSLCNVKMLDTQWLIERSLAKEPQDHVSLERLSDWMTSLVEERYDKIINLTFSPFSSYLAYLISSGMSEVRGYSRHRDGSLSIPDDTSAYFYAQVGVGRPNRFHLTEIFAAILGVDLTESDWSDSKVSQQKAKQHVVVHLGASQSMKTLPPIKWNAILRRLLEVDVIGAPLKISIIGSSEERAIAHEVLIGHDTNRILNKVGELSLQETFEWVRGADLVIGGDSSPMHMATLTGTPGLNLSIGAVNFWETGPMALGSRILRYENADMFTSEDVVQEAVSILDRSRPSSNCFSLTDRTRSYEREGDNPDEDFTWSLVRAIYQGQGFPAPKNSSTWNALQRLNEVNQLACEQIEHLKQNPRNRTAVSILERTDEMLIAISRLSSEVGPLVQWCLTEKVRIPPLDLVHVLERTEFVHKKLQEIIEFYLNPLRSKEPSHVRDHDLKA